MHGAMSNIKTFSIIAFVLSCLVVFGATAAYAQQFEIDGGGGGGWSPTVSISASPTAITSGSSSVLSWSSTDASYGCIGYGFNTGGATSGSVSVSPTANTTYSIECSNDFDFAYGSATVTVSAPSPTVDLASGTPILSTGTLVNGNSVTFSGSVTNGGGANTTATFSNRFQIDLGANGTYDTNISAASTMVGLNAAQSKTATSLAWTASTGTHKIRLCADNPTSVVVESNEGNNCGADFTFTVTAPSTPTATVSASPTSITSGQSSTITWSSTNATSCTGTNFSTGNQASGSATVSPTTSTTYSVTCSGTGGTATQSTTVTVSAGQTYNTTTQAGRVCSGGTVVGTTAYTSNSCVSYCAGLSASCCTTRTRISDTDGASYTCTAYQGTQATVAQNNTNSCSGGAEPICTSTSWTATLINYGPAVTASLVTNPTSISAGQSAVVTWSSANATSCTGTGFSTGNATSGSVTVSPSNTTTYSLSCTGAGGTATDSKTLTVNVFTVTCSPSPNPVTVNQSVSWTSAATGGTGSYTYVWSGTDSLTSTGSSVNKTYTTLGEKLATLAVTSGGSTITTACTGAPCQQASCTCSGVGCGVVVQEGVSPDLSAGTPTIISGSPIPNGTIAFGASILNWGNNSILATFQNRFQIDIGGDGSYDLNLDTTGSSGSELVLEYGKTCSTGSIVATDGAQIYGSGDLEGTIQALCEVNATVGQCCGAVVTAGSSGGGGGGGNSNVNLVRSLDRSLASVYSQLALTYYDIAVTVYSNPTKSTCPTGQTCYAGVWQSLNGTEYNVPFGGSAGAVSPSWTNIPGGTHKVRMCADSPTSQFGESNEGNNCGPDYTFAVSGFDLVGGATGINSGSLIGNQPVTFFANVTNSPSTYTATGQCRATVVVSAGGACSIAVSRDSIQWTTSGATQVTSIAPLTTSPTVPQTGGGGMIVTSPTELGFFTSQALKADMLANGNVSFPETSYVNRTGFSDQVTLDRACKMITGQASATAKAWGARGWSSCGNNYNLTFNGTVWINASGCTGAHLFSQLDCQYPGSPYALTGSYTFPTPLSEGTHTYQLTSNSSTNNTCQATIVVPAQTSGLCTLTATPSIISSGQSSTLSWTTNNASSFSIDNGIGVVTPTSAGSRSVSPTQTTTYTGTVVTNTATFGFTGNAPNTFQIDVGNNGTWDTNISGSPTTNLGVNQTAQVISPSWTATTGTHAIRFCTNTPSGAQEGDTTDNCGPIYTFTVSAPTQCQDGNDNNGNGLVDLNDPACVNSGDTTEEVWAAAQLTLNPTQGSVRKGGATQLTWSATNVQSGSCTITSTAGDSWPLSGTSGTRNTASIQAETTYTLSCLDMQSDAVTSATAKVKLVPFFEEI